jgi:hypothetical protein
VRVPRIAPPFDKTMYRVLEARVLTKPLPYLEVVSHAGAGRRRLESEAEPAMGAERAAGHAGHSVLARVGAGRWQKKLRREYPHCGGDFAGHRVR